MSLINQMLQDLDARRAAHGAGTRLPDAVRPLPPRKTSRLLLFLGIVKNALPVVGISPFWQMAISGSAILIAIAFNARGNRNPGRIILKQAEHRT